MKSLSTRAAVATSIIAVLLATAVARSAIPDEFARLVEVKGPGVFSILEEPTLFRVTELDGLPCSSEVFEFLIDRPRLAMVLGRALDPAMDAYEIRETGDGSYRVDDGGKLVGVVELVEDGRGRRIYYISGFWKFSLGLALEGRMVLVPEYEESGDREGGRSVNTTTRGYMKVDNPLVGLLAKMVAHLFPGKVDGRINRFADSVKKVAEAMRDDPVGLYRLLLASDQVTAAEADEFREMALGGRLAGNPRKTS